MSDSERSQGGFAADPSTALSVSGAGGCCGNGQRSTLAPADPDAGPCCGTTADARAEGSCCGNTAKGDAVAAGQGCCG